MRWPVADVCLILEGTYPYVYGGVASWTHALIKGLPHLTFEILYLGSRSDQLPPMQYELPANVLHLREVFLFDEFSSDTGALNAKNLQAAMASFQEFQTLIQGNSVHDGFDIFQSPEDLQHAKFNKQDLFKLKKFAKSMSSESVLRHLQSEDAWDVIVDEYERVSPMKQGLPFLDFFYSWRAIQIPLLRLINLSYPNAKVYHSMCTGYAGLCGILAAMQHASPFMVTEHGIYAHERAIELGEANWLYDPGLLLQLPFEPLKHFRSWWINVFRNLSALAYAGASRVVTLHGGNRKRQVFDGADPKKCFVVPNGVHNRYQGIRTRHPLWPKKRAEKRPFEILFLGRVVSIKDIKLLIKSIKLLFDLQVSQAEPISFFCRIVGPHNEEKDYVKECEEMVQILGLSQLIKFEGLLPATEVLQTADVLVLTSISESQPLVILEASSAGVPVVATDVGACREMILGLSEADRILGPSGLIVPLGDGLGIAQSIMRLMMEDLFWEECSQAGMLRAGHFYHEKELFEQYDKFYNELICGVDISGINQESLPWQE